MIKAGKRGERHGPCARLDRGTGGGGSGLCAAVCVGFRLAEGGGGPVRRQLPHGAAAAGPVDPEDPDHGAGGGGSLCVAGEAAGGG